MNYESTKHEFFRIVDDFPMKSWKKIIPYSSGYKEYRYYGSTHDKITELVDEVWELEEFEITDEQYQQMLKDEEVKRFADSVVEWFEDVLNDKV